MFTKNPHRLYQKVVEVVTIVHVICIMTNIKEIRYRIDVTITTQYHNLPNIVQLRRNHAKMNPSKLVRHHHRQHHRRRHPWKRHRNRQKRLLIQNL